MKFCPNCRAPIKTPDQKFCTECSCDLQPFREAQTIQSPPIKKDFKTIETEDQDIGESQPIKLNTYTLGVKLENTVADIFVSMGYNVQKRVHYPMPHGRSAEFDLVLTRGNRKRAVECKNYGS